MSEEIYSVVQHSTNLHSTFCIILLTLLNPDDNTDITENSHFTQTVNKLITINTGKVPAKFILYYYLINCIVKINRIP